MTLQSCVQSPDPLLKFRACDKGLCLKKSVNVTLHTYKFKLQVVQGYAHKSCIYEYHRVKWKRWIWEMLQAFVSRLTAFSSDLLTSISQRCDFRKFQVVFPFFPLLMVMYRILNVIKQLFKKRIPTLKDFFLKRYRHLFNWENLLAFPFYLFRGILCFFGKYIRSHEINYIIIYSLYLWGQITVRILLNDCPSWKKWKEILVVCNCAYFYLFI